MPKADTFTALGRGNGFGFCPKKVDVSEFDNWITLGGVSSGSASKAEINKSLVNAMKLYWNLHSATASFTAIWNGNGISFNKGLPDHEYEIITTPKERLCEDITQPDISSTGMTEAELNETDGSGVGTLGRFQVLAPSRMYNGSTSNESKFVGYGVSILFSGTAGGNHPEGTLDAGASVTVASYLNGTTESGQRGPDPQGNPSVFFFDRRASELILDDIPFRSFSSANAGSAYGPSGISKTLTTSANSASFNAGFVSGNASVSGSVTIPVDFKFDFYTY
tara:strand:- start:33 stop:869 length:837 start_codon:yes stop_codon:yes gene_type:complete